MQLQKLEDGQDVKQFHPPSSVQSRQLCGEVSYVKTLFLDSDQVLKFTGAQPQHLGLHPATRTAEDGVTILTGYYIRADDLPEDMTWQTYQGLRKARVSMV